MVFNSIGERLVIVVENDITRVRNHAYKIFHQIMYVDVFEDKRSEDTPVQVLFDEAHSRFMQTLTDQPCFQVMHKFLST